MTNHQLINQTSGEVEYYTPQPIIEAARQTMGGIDLDPASSAAANARVKAKEYFNEDHDGLSQKWYGRVWVNHPFGRISNPLWIKKLQSEVQSGRVAELCCITFACTSEQWFQPLLLQPQCFLSPRTNYVLPDGTTLQGVSKGSVVTYYGPNTDKFIQAFKSLGVVKGILCARRCEHLL